MDRTAPVYHPARDARIACSVIVPIVSVILANRTDHVAFHDLHVVDVVQQLEVIAANSLDQFNAPS